MHERVPGCYLWVLIGTAETIAAVHFNLEGKRRPMEVESLTAHQTVGIVLF
jgi:hypothetical protein